MIIATSSQFNKIPTGIGHFIKSAAQPFSNTIQFNRVSYWSELSSTMFFQRTLSQLPYFYTPRTLE